MNSNGIMWFYLNWLIMDNNCIGYLMLLSSVCVCG